MKENDVTTVINLRGIGEFDGFDEEKAASSSGLIYHALPISGAAGVTFENAEKLAQLIQQSEGKVLIHCASGNRAGALLALKSFSIDNMSVDDSMALGKQAGMTRLSKAVEAKLRQAKKNK